MISTLHCTPSLHLACQELPADPVTASSADITAILGTEEKYGEKLQRKFFQFVKGYIQKLTPEVLIFDTVTRRFSDERCKFWQNGTDSLIEKYGRKF